MSGERDDGREQYANWHPPKDGDKDESVGPEQRERVTTLKVGDVGMHDRVFIITESGSRYMIRRSKSRGGGLMIYKEESAGFQTGYPLRPSKENQSKGQDFVAQVGESFNFAFVTNEKDNVGRQMKSTNVKEIELRKNADYYAEQGKVPGESFVGSVRRGRTDDLAQKVLRNK